MRMIRFLILLMMLCSCASKLPRGGHSTPPVEAQLDFTKINFRDLDSGNDVTLNTYFSTSGKSWLLLFFGAKGCTSCGDKMKVIRDSALQDPIFNTPEGKNLDIIAVYTNDITARQQVIQYRDQNKYVQLKWLDPMGATLLKWFLPKEQKDFGVPVTVFVNWKKAKVEWSFPSISPYTIDNVMARVRETLNKPQPPEPTPPPSPSPTPFPSPTPVPSLNFTFYGGSGLFTLKDTWPKKRVTVVSVFGELCTGCWEELSTWSKPNSLADLCTKESCQIITIENGVPEEEPTEKRWPRIHALMEKKGVDKFWLALDPLPSDGDAWKNRYFDGYLSTKFPEWEGLFGTVLYDETGTIFATVKGGGDPEEVTKLVRNKLNP
jgi:hypothetical protein